MNLISKIPKKMLITLSAGAVCIVAVIAGYLIINGRKDYRLIQVYEIEGTAVIERQGDEMKAYPGMQLNSGDVLSTKADSYAQLKLDEDKYILMEPDTKITLEASGSSQDSKTSIHLEQGAIVNRLDNKLSEKSSYQVTTPNSTMAVRGTTFRVAITYDEEGICQADLSVFGGKVQCDVKLLDTKKQQEAVMVEKGYKVLVWGDEEGAEYSDIQSVEYEELKQEALTFLYTAIHNGNDLSISEEEIEVIIQAIEALENVEETPKATAEPTMSPEPTPLETATPVPSDTPKPTAEPTKVPTAEPTIEASPTPTATPVPTAIPTAKPTPEPEQPTPYYVETSTSTDSSAGSSYGEQVVETPAPLPTQVPAASSPPAEDPNVSASATSTSTSDPSADDTSVPDTTGDPSEDPTENPTENPAEDPTPSAEPAETPTAVPSDSPTATPDAGNTENGSDPAASTSSDVGGDSEEGLESSTGEGASPTPSATPET